MDWDKEVVADIDNCRCEIPVKIHPEQRIWTLKKRINV